MKTVLFLTIYNVFKFTLIKLVGKNYFTTSIRSTSTRISEWSQWLTTCLILHLLYCQINVAIDSINLYLETLQDLFMTQGSNPRHSVLNNHNGTYKSWDDSNNLMSWWNRLMMSINYACYWYKCFKTYFMIRTTFIS